MKNKIAGLIVAVLALALPHAGSAAPLDEVKERGTVRIAVYSDFAPFSSLVDGQPAGLDVELGRIIAAELGVQPEIRLQDAGETVADDLRIAVWKGSKLSGEVLSDIMLHVPVDPEFAQRNNTVVISGPYFKEELAVARRQPPTVLANMTGDHIGVETDSLADLYLSGSFQGRFRESLTHYRTITAAAEALVKGDIDTVIATRSQLEAALKDHAVPVTTIAFPGLLKANWPVGFAVKENSRDLAYAVEDILAKLAEDGRLKALYEKYGLTYTAP